MSEFSILWDAGNTDAGPYEPHTGSWRDFMLTLAGVRDDVTQGVYPGLFSELACSIVGGSIRVASGRGLCDGSYYGNTANQNVTPTTPSTGTTGVLIVMKKTFTSPNGKVRLDFHENTDGTAAIPSPTQTDGTTWETPIASCTIDTSGTLAGLSDRRIFLPFPNHGMGSALAGGAVTLDARGSSFHILNGNVSSISARAKGDIVNLICDAAGVLTHNATSLILPHGADITTFVNDAFQFVSEGSGNWRLLSKNDATLVSLHNQNGVLNLGDGLLHTGASLTLTPGVWMVYAIVDMGAGTPTAPDVTITLTGGGTGKTSFRWQFAALTGASPNLTSIPLDAIYTVAPATTQVVSITAIDAGVTPPNGASVLLSDIIAIRVG